jgi:hypothetical protein
VRRVIGLSDTSTIWARPCGSKWLKDPWLMGCALFAARTAGAKARLC